MLTRRMSSSMRGGEYTSERSEMGESWPVGGGSPASEEPRLFPRLGKGF